MENLERKEMNEPIEYAAMESGGPWYAPIIKAHSMLGRRACVEGLMSSADVAAQIETKLRGSLPINGTGQAPTRQIVAIWEKKNPDYPEEVLTSGLVVQEDLLSWAKIQVDHGNRASGKTAGRKGSGNSRSGTSRSRSKTGTSKRKRNNPVTPTPNLLPPSIFLDWWPGG